MNDGDARVSEVRFTAATPEQVDEGLLGFAACRYGVLRLDGIAVRRTLDGRLTLSYPARRDSSGRKHFLIRPLDDAGRRLIEFEVLKALGLEGDMIR